MAIRKKATPELGKKYRDTISGFEGMAVAVTTYLYGCNRWQLSGVLNGEPKDFVFDEPALEAVATPRPIKPQQKTGGARPPMPRTGH